MHSFIDDYYYECGQYDQYDQQSDLNLHYDYQLGPIHDFAGSDHNVDEFDLCKLYYLRLCGSPDDGELLLCGQKRLFLICSIFPRKAKHAASTSTTFSVQSRTFNTDSWVSTTTLGPSGTALSATSTGPGVGSIIGIVGGGLIGLVCLAAVVGCESGMPKVPIPRGLTDWSSACSHHPPCIPSKG